MERDPSCTVTIQDGASLDQWLAQLADPAMAQYYETRLAEQRRLCQQYGQYAAPEPTWPATLYDEGGPSSE